MLSSDVRVNPLLHGFRTDLIDLAATATGDLGGHRSARGYGSTSAALYAEIAARLRRHRFEDVFAPFAGEDHQPKS